MNLLRNASAVLEMGCEEWPQEDKRHARKHRLCRWYVSGVIALLLSGPTWAAPTASLSAGTTNPAVAETFTVTLNLANAPAFACWGAVTRYDGTKLALVSQTNGSFSAFVADSRGMAAMNLSGEARTGGYGMSNNVGGAGTLAVLTFQAITEGVTTIALEPESQGEPFGLALYSTNGTAAIPTVGAALQIAIGSGGSVDTDGDGMPDSWENTYLGDTNASPTADADLDGMSNLHEFLAGTNPTNAASLLRILSAIRNPQSEIEIRWSSVAGKKYTIQKSTNLMSGFTATEVSGIDGDPPTNSYPVTLGTSGSGFYRVRVKLE